MNILITGVTGFLGGRLINAFGADSRLYAVVRDMSKWQQPEGKENITPIEADLKFEESLSALPDQIDVIVHLAQSRQYRDFPNGMRDMVGVNIQGTLNLIEYGRRAGCKHFIYTSTGSVYSPEPGARQCEATLVAPSQPYAVTKYGGELVLQPYSGQYMKTLILRLFFLYGNGQANTLIPNLIDRVRSGHEITLGGKAAGMEFCPTHVDDVANVICSAIDTGKTGIYNVANPEVWTLRDAVNAIASEVSETPNFTQLPDQNAPVYRPDLSRLGEWHDLESSFRGFRDGLSELL